MKQLWISSIKCAAMAFAHVRCAAKTKMYSSSQRMTTKNHSNVLQAPFAIRETMKLQIITLQRTCSPFGMNVKMMARSNWIMMEGKLSVMIFHWN